jgi:hypothetical protein
MKRWVSPSSARAVRTKSLPTVIGELFRFRGSARRAMTKRGAVGL